MSRAAAEAEAEAEVMRLTKEVREFMGRHKTESTWSVLQDIKSFNERLHESFDWIGRMLTFTMQHEVPVDWASMPTERDELGGRARDSLEEFMEWFDAPGPKGYSPAVQEFWHLQEVMAYVEDIAVQEGVPETSPRLRTLQRLQRDVDEIVGHIKDKMRIKGENVPVQSLSALLRRLKETVRDVRDVRDPWLEETPGYECIEELWSVVARMVELIDDSVEKLSKRGVLPDKKKAFLRHLRACGENNMKEYGQQAFTLIRTFVESICAQYASDLEQRPCPELVKRNVALGRKVAQYVEDVCSAVVAALKSTQTADGRGYCRVMLAELQQRAPFTVERAAQGT